MATYTVQKGDSYWKIARNLDPPISPVELLRLNDLDMTQVNAGAGGLQVGQTINIPDTTTDTEDTVEGDTGGFDDPYAPADPVAELVGDPAYDAFMAQYGLTITDIEDQYEMQTNALIANMQSQLGTMLDQETGAPWSMEEERTGGMLGRAEERAMKQTTDMFAGKGMHFSGGAAKARSDVMKEADAAELSYWNELTQARDEYGMSKRRSLRDLEMQKLSAESAAYTARRLE